jgi:hypothetical protein
VRRPLLRFVPVLVLAAENLAIFHRHYFGGWGFPWDFVGSYYAAAAYWTQAVERAAGGLPMWMPFQSMGYPFLVNIQTGLFYPPMWIFPLLRIPYTLPAAVVLQCLHVLAGAIGMYALLRVLVHSRREALLGAFAFQLFGGFYSNSEHVDIVRACALLPWLLWAISPAAPAGNRGGLSRRMLLAPLFVFALATGGYPGNFVAALFMVTAFAGFVLIERRFASSARTWAAAVAGALVLGVAMAAIHLGPAWMYREELLRYHVAARLYRASLSVVHLPGLILENRGMPVDVSMTSTFVGFAVLAGVCLLSRQSLRRFWPWAALGLLAALMAAGDMLPLHPFLRRLLAPLGYSRFPSSDYRVFAAVALVVLAAAGWRDLRLLRRRWNPAGFALRLAPLALFAAWSIRRVYSNLPFWPLPAFAVACLAAAVLGLLAFRRLERVGLAALLCAIALDGARVLPRIQEWRVPDLIGTSRVFSPTPARMHDAGVVVDSRLFEIREGARPPRTDGDGPYRASGYLTGAPVTGDFGGPVLRARDLILKNPAYLAWMRRESLPILAAPSPAVSGSAVDVTDLPARALSAAPDPRIVPLSWGIDGARYRVSTPEPLLAVENEVYFPGWKAAAGGKIATLAAVRVNGLFRGWILPAGDYELWTEFQVPHLRILAAASAAAWMGWFAIAGISAARAKRRRALRLRA